MYSSALRMNHPRALCYVESETAMDDFDGWKKIEPALGEGGQGTVYKARSPERANYVQQSINKIVHELRQLNGIGRNEPKQIEDLMKRIVDVGGGDDAKDLGALKVFKIPSGLPESNKAGGRLVQEITRMGSNARPAVVKLR